jgi:hypothetical protein
MSSERFGSAPDSARLEREPSSRRVAHSTEHEQLHLRNYDRRQGYDLDFRLCRDDQCAFDRRIYLQPGGVRCLGGLVQPGEWQVVVSLDGKPSTREQCSIGPSIGQTAVIECGNGVVTVTERC